MVALVSFAKGECGVFANSLKRIGKWRRLAFATGFAIRWSEWQTHSHLPMAKQANVAALRILTLKRMANRTRRHKLQVLCVILISGSGLTLLPPPNINRPFDLLIFDVAIWFGCDAIFKCFNFRIILNHLNLWHARKEENFYFLNLCDFVLLCCQENTFYE